MKPFTLAEAQEFTQLEGWKLLRDWQLVEIQLHNEYTIVPFPVFYRTFCLILQRKVDLRELLDIEQIKREFATWKENHQNTTPTSVNTSKQPSQNWYCRMTTAEQTVSLLALSAYVGVEIEISGRGVNTWAHLKQVTSQAAGILLREGVKFDLHFQIHQP